MRIKKFTLMTLALLVSMVSFAQKFGTQPLDLKQARPMELQTVPKTVVPGSFKMRTTTSAKPSTTFRADAVTPPAGSEPEYYKLTGNYYVYSATIDDFVPVAVERTVEVVIDGNNVYISKICYYQAASNYVKGTIDGNTVTFAKGQYLGNAGADIYFAAESTTGAAIDATATFDSQTMTFTFNETIGMWNETLKGEYGYIEDLVVAYDENIEIPLEPPTDLVTEAWALTANSFWEPYDPVSKPLTIGFYGDDEVYIQGLCDYLPEAWIVGTREGNTITCPMLQFYGQLNSYKLYFFGLANDNWSDVVFTYDPDANTLKTDAAIFLRGLNTATEKVSNFEAFNNVTISKIVEKAATPATPSITSFGFLTSGSTVEFNIPIVDTDGNGMIADKLNYQLFYKDGQSDEAHPVVLTPDLYTKIATDMSIIPYTFTDDYDIYNTSIYLNMDWSSWTEMGIKSIYNGGDESHESPISWKAIERPTTTVVPQGLKLTVNAFEGTQASSSGSTPFTGKQLTVAISGDDIYIQGLSQDSNDGKAWVKGTKSGNTYVFKRGQSLGGNYYLIGYDDTTDEVQDAVLNIDTESGVYVMQNEFIVNSTYIDHLHYSDWYESNSTISINGTADEPVTPPAGLETQDAFMSGYLNTGSAVVTKQNVKIGRDGNDVYVQGIFKTMPEAWAKGTFKDESTITFEPQLIAMTPDYTKYYLLGSDDGRTIVPLNFSYKTTKKGEVVVEQLAPTFYSINTAKDKLNTRYYGYSVGIHTMKATETVPEQLTTDKYSLTYEDADKAPAAKVIEFGILDNKAYLKGISADAPNAWIVGDVEGSSIKFETPQALANDGSVVFISYDAVNTKTMPYFELTWDATAKTLASVGDYVAIVNNKMITRPYYLEMMSHMNATVIADVAATPADPEFENMHFTYYGDYIGFDVKTVSTTGEGLLPEKLYYKMYSKDAADVENPIVFTKDVYTKLTADMTEIPYGFEDAEGGYDFGADFVYLNMNEHLTWKQIGIQAIYKGGNAENTSNIVWYTIVQPKVAVLPEGAEVTEHTFAGTTTSSATGTVTFNTKVKLAKVDNSIYIQGLQGDAWVRGNLTAENTYTFANGQYLGDYQRDADHSYMLFLLGVDTEGKVANSVIQLNTATNKYEFMTNVLVNMTYTDRTSGLILYHQGCTIDVVETGISTVKADAQFNANAPAYNMAGQRVDKDFKGLVIKGGKKFVIK